VVVQEASTLQQSARKQINFEELMRMTPASPPILLGQTHDTMAQHYDKVGAGKEHQVLLGGSEANTKGTICSCHTQCNQQ